jgi:hypothetical protein
VCHSLGGIVVKTALFQAKSKDRYNAILEDTIGTIFVGTPHQGSGFANVADVAQQIARVVLYKPKAILTGLKKNCHQLFETASNFADVSGNIKIFCFYETMRPEVGLLLALLLLCDHVLTSAFRSSAKTVHQQEFQEKCYCLWRMSNTPISANLGTTEIQTIGESEILSRSSCGQPVPHADQSIVRLWSNLMGVMLTKCSPLG